jgi:hypothetical protein
MPAQNTDVRVNACGRARMGVASIAANAVNA